MTHMMIPGLRFASFRDYPYRCPFLYQDVAIRYYSKSTQDTFSKICMADLKELRRNSLFIPESQDRTIVSNIKEPHIKFSHHLRSFVDFTSMDHLGFQSNTSVVTAYNKALVKEALYGHEDFKKGLKLELEAAIAEFHNRSACLLYKHVPDVKRKLLRVLNTADDIILYDGGNDNAKYIMSSCVATTVQFCHQNTKDLIEKLHMHKDKRYKMILLDFTFPFIGKAPPLRDIAQIAEDHQCLLVADDTYGVGLIGNNIRGAEETLSFQQRPLLLTKSFIHGNGTNLCGYLVGPDALVQHISKLNIMKEYLDVPASLMSASLKIVSLLTKPETKRASQNVQRMANHIRENLDAAGYDVDTSGLPVVSIRVGKESLLMEFADQLQDAGILCSASKYPQVPKGESRLCIATSVHHTPEVIDSALETIFKVGSRLKIPR